MKKELLKKYFNKIKEATDGDNTSNSEIIDYQNGTSISIDEIEQEYYNYLNLQDEISEYIEEKELDDVINEDEIKKHFADKINEDLFEYNQAVLKNFVDYMAIKLKKG